MGRKRTFRVAAQTISGAKRPVLRCQKTRLGNGSEAEANDFSRKGALKRLPVRLARNRSPNNDLTGAGLFNVDDMHHAKLRSMVAASLRSRRCQMFVALRLSSSALDRRADRTRGKASYTSRHRK